jgi:hypothetical protein
LQQQGAGAFHQVRGIPRINCSLSGWLRIPGFSKLLFALPATNIPAEAQDPRLDPLFMSEQGLIIYIDVHQFSVRPSRNILLHTGARIEFRRQAPHSIGQLDNSFLGTPCKIRDSILLGMAACRAVLNKTRPACLT